MAMVEMKDEGENEEEEDDEGEGASDDSKGQAADEAMHANNGFYRAFPGG